MNKYQKTNFEVMTDTQKQYTENQELKEAVKESISRQYMVSHEEVISLPAIDNRETNYITSGKRSFEAAKGYKGKKVAVLNFANNHFIGGSPFYAGAQEESLCRCSTLLPCLEAMRIPFYNKHIDDYEKGIIDFMGNDDLIYTPDVVVFKTDERTDLIYPKMMPHDEWYKVDVITCAAPDFSRGQHLPRNYEEQITSRIKKILDVACKERVEVLILGAWGCGAFKNPSEIVARVFHTLLQNYDFETVEFALDTCGDVSNSLFRMKKEKDSNKRLYTPDDISELKPNEIFVFGSNLQGHHMGGSAKVAMNKFGAIFGQGVGLQGNSYAIPTMQGGTDTIKLYVDQFIDFAKTHSELIFYVTKIGCGTAGFKEEEIAPLFSEALQVDNIALPQNFVDIIDSNRKEIWNNAETFISCSPEIVNLWRDAIQDEMKALANRFFDSIINEHCGTGCLGMGLSLCPIDVLKEEWSILFHYHKFATCPDLMDGFKSFIDYQEIPNSLKLGIRFASVGFKHHYCSNYGEYIVAKEVQRLLEELFNKPSTQDYLLNNDIQPRKGFGWVELDEDIM